MRALEIGSENKNKFSDFSVLNLNITVAAGREVNGSKLTVVQYY